MIFAFFFVLALAETPKILHEHVGAKWSVGYLERDGKVYFYSDSKAPTLIPGADPHSFEILDKESSVGSYTRDRKRVYYRNFPLESAQRDSFVAMGAYGKDAEHVFYQERKIEGASAKSFEMLSDCEGGNYFGPSYTKDHSSVFFNGHRVKGADASTFKMECDKKLKFDARDKNRLYLAGKPLSP